MYATRQDMIDRFGERELVELTDRHDAPLGLIDDAVESQARVRASAEIDTYVRVRYALPLPLVPERLIDIACDIARYHLYVNGTPDTVRDRYRDALRALEAIAAGRSLLDLPEASAPAGLVEIVTGEPVWKRGSY